MKKLIQISETEYKSDDEIVIKREFDTFTPNNNKMNGRWVCRNNGVFVDMDYNRNDLFERLNFSI